MPSCGLPAFVDEVPEYLVKDGRMYITMGDFCLAMPINVFLQGCARGQVAIRIWQSERCGEVLDFPVVERIAGG